MSMFILQIPTYTPVRDYKTKMIVGHRLSFEDGPGFQTTDANAAMAIAKAAGHIAPILRDTSWVRKDDITEE